MLIEFAYMRTLFTTSVDKYMLHETVRICLQMHQHMQQREMLDARSVFGRGSDCWLIALALRSSSARTHRSMTVRAYLYKLNAIVDPLKV